MIPHSMGKEASATRAKEASAALAGELCQKPPAGLRKALEREELDDLADAIRAQRRRQTAALRAAGDQALGNLPWVVRGPVKRIVGA